MQTLFGPFSPEKKSDLQKYVIDPFKRVYNDLSTKWEAVGCQVAHWNAKTIPQKYQPLVMRIFHALPFALVCAWMPLSLTVTIGVGTYITHIAYGPFAQSTYDNVFSGASLGMGYRSAINVTSFLVTFNPLYLITAAMYALATSVLFSRANLVAERN